MVYSSPMPAGISSSPCNPGQDKRSQKNGWMYGRLVSISLPTSWWWKPVKMCQLLTCCWLNEVVAQLLDSLALNCVSLYCVRESHFFPPLPTFLKNPKWGITLCLFVCSPRGMIKCSVLLQTSALLSVRRSSKVSTGLSTKWDSQSTTGLSVFCGASLPGVKSKLGQTLWDYISDSQLTGLTQVL